MLQRRKVMTDSAQPFAVKKFLEIKGRRMAYIDEGEGAPIVFAHGNPTSSYLRRNVMPACRGLGRPIACDMIGMGDSEKLLEAQYGRRRGQAFHPTAFRPHHATSGSVTSEPLPVTSFFTKTRVSLLPLSLS